MKVTLTSDNLQKKVSLCAHALSTKNQLPILNNFALSASNGKLVIKSTDLEIGIEASVPAQVEEEGSITVIAKTFIELINSFPSEQITLSTKDNQLEIITKKTRSVVQASPIEEFPQLFEEKGQEIATLSHDAFKDDIATVLFASSSDPSRPSLTGVLIKPEEKGFLFVATDGYRLSLKHKELESTSKSTEDIIIPARVLREIMNLREEDSVHLFLSKEKNQILATNAQDILVGRLIESEYPPYEKIIPVDFSARITYNRQELLKAIKICSIFARESANIVKLTLKKDKIIVSSNSSAIGENTVEVEANLTGEENEIAFNVKYLLDVLGNVSSEEMQLEMTGPLNPGVFKILDDPSYLHLIMPIRVQG